MAGPVRESGEDDLVEGGQAEGERNLAQGVADGRRVRRRGQEEGSGRTVMVRMRIGWEDMREAK